MENFLDKHFDKEKIDKFLDKVSDKVAEIIANYIIVNVFNGENKKSNIGVEPFKPYNPPTITNPPFGPNTVVMYGCISAPYTSNVDDMNNQFTDTTSCTVNTKQTT